MGVPPAAGLALVWPHDPGPIPASYEQAVIYVVNVHLQKAGIRLAAVLNAPLP